MGCTDALYPHEIAVEASTSTVAHTTKACLEFVWIALPFGLLFRSFCYDRCLLVIVLRGFIRGRCLGRSVFSDHSRLASRLLAKGEGSSPRKEAVEENRAGRQGQRMCDRDHSSPFWPARAGLLASVRTFLFAAVLDLVLTRCILILPG